MSLGLVEDIAREVGVSKRTVKRVLSGASNPRETRPTIVARANQIRKLAEERDYRPNAAARAIATGRFNSVAFVQRAEMALLPFSLIEGVTDELALQNLHMICTRMAEADVRSEAKMPKVFTELCVDGLLVHESIDIPDEVQRMLHGRGIPTIWLNAKQKTDCVYPDDKQGMRQIVDLLLELGHRRILFCNFGVFWSGGQDHFCWADRRSGYVASMEHAGLSPRMAEHLFTPVQGLTLDGRHQLGEPWGTDSDDRIARAKAILDATDRPTAIVAPSIHGAAPFLYAAASMGMSVPADLSVCAVGDSSATSYGFRMTMAEVPWRGVGTEGVRLLTGKIANPQEPLKSVRVPYGRIIGNTHGRCGAIG